MKLFIFLPYGHPWNWRKSVDPIRRLPVHRLVEDFLQFDLWNKDYPLSGRHDWTGLKSDIKQYGLRNSLLLAQMPTASTSQILGNTESSEPLSSNIYVRRTLSGEFQVVNKYLINDLITLGLWNNEMKYDIMRHNGSVQHITQIPSDVKDLYKTVYEMKTKTLVDMSAERGHFIDQSESFNCFIGQPTMKRLTSLHFYTWKKGLKTGCYYLRTIAASNPLQITIPVSEPCESCSA